MRLLWFFVAVATGVMAEDIHTCSIGGDPHLKPFNNTQEGQFLINFPCRYLVTTMCLHNNDEGCKAELFIYAKNGNANSRGRTFVSRVDGMVLNGNISGKFVLDGNNLDSDPWVEDTGVDARNLLCIDTSDGKTAFVSFRNSTKECIPVFTFTPWGPVTQKPGLVIKAGQEVRPFEDESNRFPNSLCGQQDGVTAPIPAGLTLQQGIMRAQLNQHVQTDGMTPTPLIAVPCPQPHPSLSRSCPSTGDHHREQSMSSCDGTTHQKRHCTVAKSLRCCSVVAVLIQQMKKTAY